jgi:hypothetical protein
MRLYGNNHFMPQYLQELSADSQRRVRRSLGSKRGHDVIAIDLNQRYNIGIGKIIFFNLV